VVGHTVRLRTVAPIRRMSGRRRMMIAADRTPFAVPPGSYLSWSSV
jgi:hypothetical protein